MYFVSLLDLTINLHIYESMGGGGLFPSMDVNCPPSIHLHMRLWGLFPPMDGNCPPGVHSHASKTMGTVSIHGCKLI